MRTQLTIFLFFIIYSMHKALALDCSACICRQESQCKPLGCHMDDGSLSCGYYQLKREYYIDCGMPGRPANVIVGWLLCSRNLLCSRICFANYIRRYAGQCAGVTDACERMARLHNGGPDGCQLPRTDVYWSLIQKCLNEGKPPTESPSPANPPAPMDPLDDNSTKDMESYGLTTPSVLKQMLATCQDPIETIKKFQSENGIQLDTLNPALKLLDLHGIRRAELHEAVAGELAEKTVQKIRALGEKRTPQSVAALGRQLDRCFKLYRIPRIRPIVLETLRQLPIIPDRYLRLIVCDSELYRSCDVGVRRQIWAKNSELFVDDVSAVIDAYVEAKDRLLLSVDKSPTNFFTCDTTRTRRQWPQIRELMNMIGDEEVLYTQLVAEIRRRFAAAPNGHLCALRAEILMATHESSVEYAIHVDPCHDFAWCLDTCIRDKHWDAQQTTKLRNLLDAGRKEFGKPGDLADMAMIARDPHAVHFLASMAVKIVRDGVNAAGGHLPREHQALHLILRLLYLGANATELLHDDTPPSLAAVVDCVTQFMPSFAYLMAENLLRFELQRAPDEIADEFYGELPVDEPTMEQLADYLRSDEVCALLWLHYLLDVMPSKRRFLQRGALYRYIQYLPILANGTGTTDPWIHLFLHRLIQTNVFDAIIADDRIGRRIIHSMLIDDLKIQPSAKFHLLRLCLHLRAHIGDDLMRDANEALVKLYEELQVPRNALTDGSVLSDALPANKLDEFFLQELEKYRSAVPGIAFTAAAVTTVVPTDFSAYSSLSVEAVAAASLGD